MRSVRSRSILTLVTGALALGTMVPGAGVLAQSTSPSLDPTSSASPPVGSPEPSGSAGIPIGPGFVVPGQTGSITELAVTSEEDAAAQAAFSGATIGVLLPWFEAQPGSDSMLAIAKQTAADLKTLGAKTSMCLGDDGPSIAGCFKTFAKKKARAVIVMPLLAANAALGPAVAKGVAGGTPAVLLGEAPGAAGSGAIQIGDKTWIASENGRLAGEYAASKWPGEAVDALIVAFDDPVSVSLADAAEAALATADPSIALVLRAPLADAVDTVASSPGVRIALGPALYGAGPFTIPINAGTLTPPDGFGVFPQYCPVDVEKATALVKGCLKALDNKTLAAMPVTVLTRLLLGGTIPEIVRPALEPFVAP